MKKIIAVFLGLTMLFATAAAMEVNENRVVSAQNEKKIVINYSNYVDEHMSIIVYDVTNIPDSNVNTAYVDKETTPAIGISQNDAEGNFEIPIKSGFSGKVVIMISGRKSGTVRTLLEITEGIPNPLEVAYDAKNLEYVLGADEQIEIKADAKLRNAVIDATEGSVLYGDTILSGRILFNAECEIDSADTNTIVTLKSSVSNGYYHQGFIKKVNLKEASSPYIVKFTADNGSTYDASFKLNDGIFSGTARFTIGIRNVPEGIEIVCE